jgi:hypothetical protein
MRAPHDDERPRRFAGTNVRLPRALVCPILAPVMDGLVPACPVHDEDERVARIADDQALGESADRDRAVAPNADVERTAFDVEEPV